MSPWARSAPCSPSKCRAWRAPTSNGTGCSNFTQTLVIDEDGIYDPADFNDSLILGMKGTFAQAELHLIRARLHGGKLHKAAKGELRFSLPVGLLFEREGTAYAVVRRFQDLGLRFPRRSYGGAWNGRLIWGRLTHSRVLGILANPFYAGSYVFGRHQEHRRLGPDGEVCTHSVPVSPEAWQVVIHDHHAGYISWDQFLANRR